MSHLHIFTLSWNGANKLQSLYNSILDSLKDIKYDWHVKDNGSIDNTDQVVSQFKCNINYIKYHNNNQNFSAGNNYIFNLAKPKDDDFILLLNNDVTFNDNKSIKNMINLFNKEKNVGAVGAKLKYKNTNKLQHAGVVFGEHTRGFPFHYRANEVDDEQSSKNREFQVVTGAVLLTKAKYYKNICLNNDSKINGMSEEFIWAFDDVDACLSIKYNQGKRILYCGKTDIFHEESVSLKNNPINKLWMSHNLARLKSKWQSNIKLDYNNYKNSVNFNIIK